MILDYVDIKNFRSIKEATINFDPRCRILVGINEPGKTNILKAISLLGDKYIPNRKDDIRVPSPDEEKIDESIIEFYFKVEKPDTDKLFQLISEKILCRSKNPEILSVENKPNKLKEFLASYEIGMYAVNIKAEEKKCKYYSIPEDCSLLEGWKKPSSNCPKDFQINFNGKNLTLSQYKFIKVKDIESDIPESYICKAPIYAHSIK